MKAIWKDIVIARSDETIVIEGNHYFPPASVRADYLTESETRSTCPWKGEAHYYSLVVDGEENKDAAWYYPEPMERAKQIKDHIAFWNGVEVIK